MALPPLSVKIGAETDGLTKGLTGAQASIAKFAKVGVAGVAAVGTAMIALTKTSLANIDVLTKQARSLGLTTAAFQKMSLVANEAGVETGKLSSMLGLMQRNIVELQNGTAKQTEVFGKLGLSIRDLQGLEPDAQFAKIAESLNSITDPAEKTAAAMEVFGRSGREAINMLSGYGAAAANAEAFQRRFGISVSQDVASNVERANDAVGRLGQVFTGLGNRMAGTVAPAVERVANGLIDFAAKVVGANDSLEDFFGTLEDARASLGENLFNRLVGNPVEIMKNADAIKEVAFSVDDLKSAGVDAATQTELLGYALRGAGKEGQNAADFMASASEEMRNLTKEFIDGKITAEEFADRISSLEKETRDAIAAFGDVNDIQFSGAMSALNGLRGMVNSVIDAANAMNAALDGEVSMQSGPTGRRGTRAGTTFATPGLAPSSATVRPRSREESRFDEFFGPADRAGGGGGGKDPNELLREQMATRLQTLMEGLMTERETVAQWYAEGQALLEEARANELLTESEYFDQKTRLQEEYNRRSQSLMNEEVQMRKSTLSSMIGLLTQFGSKNKALAKVAVALNAAQRVSEISANTAAASTRALAELGPIAGPPVAARIAAYGAMQKAIAVASAAMSAKGISSGSGGSGSISGAASSAQTSAETQAAPQATQTLNFSVTSDPFGISDRLVRQIVGAINQSQRDGSTLIRATVS
jgi:hypothetical protein